MISAASAIICPCGVTNFTRFYDELTAARGVRERHALADAAIRRRQVLLGERLGAFGGDQVARPIAIEDEARGRSGRKICAFSRSLLISTDAPSLEGEG
jgi:hypothetical protein